MPTAIFLSSYRRCAYLTRRVHADRIRGEDNVVNIKLCILRKARIRPAKQVTIVETKGAGDIPVTLGHIQNLSSVLALRGEPYLDDPVVFGNGCICIVGYDSHTF